MKMYTQALARKWRPKTFSQIKGQKIAVQILKNINHQNRLHHAYLLTGTRGVGKTTIARIIAKSLNCQNPLANEPCANCAQCIAIDAGNFIDLIEIDAASNTGVDNIRELIDNAQYLPSMAHYKVYIIDEVHMLSKSAFNALLKTLEEPPVHIIMILATTELNKVPATILSRCLQIKLRNILTTEIVDHLAFILTQEQLEFDQPSLNLIAQMANGSMRDALSILEQVIAYDQIINIKTTQSILGLLDKSLIIQLLTTIADKNTAQVQKIVNDIAQKSISWENILNQMAELVFEISLYHVGGTQQNLETQFLQLTQQISATTAQLYFEIINLALSQLSNNNNPYNIFMMSIIRMLAFNLGTSEQKTILINNANYCRDEPPINNKIPIKTNDDWHNFIKLIQKKINFLVIALQQSQLIHIDGQRIIEINSQYKDLLDKKQSAYLIQLITELSDYEQPKFIFKDQVDNTLKAKLEQQGVANEIQAREKFINDPNVKHLVDNYQATIILNSIKISQATIKTCTSKQKDKELLY